MRFEVTEGLRRKTAKKARFYLRGTLVDQSGSNFEPGERDSPRCLQITVTRSRKNFWRGDLSEVRLKTCLCTKQRDNVRLSRRLRSVVTFGRRGCAAILPHRFISGSSFLLRLPLLDDPIRSNVRRKLNHRRVASLISAGEASGMTRRRSLDSLCI